MNRMTAIHIPCFQSGTSLTVMNYVWQPTGQLGSNA